MTAVIPARFLFRWAWPVRRIDDLPAATGRLLDLPEQARCFPLGEVDGIAGFADLRLAWNLHGIGLAVHVQGKQQPLKCHPLTPTASDGVTFWLDTRATQTVHRATKYCHQFCLLPGGAGQKKDKPSVTTLPMLRGSEDRLVASAKGSPSPIQIWSDIRADGYTLEAWLPAESLVGFDPEAQPQLGFYCLIRDAELGEQFLTVGRDFPFEHDPSLWQLLELSDA